METQQSIVKPVPRVPRSLTPTPGSSKIRAFNPSSGVCGKPFRNAPRESSDSDFTHVTVRVDRRKRNHDRDSPPSVTVIAEESPTKPSTRRSSPRRRAAKRKAITEEMTSKEKTSEREKGDPVTVVDDDWGDKGMTDGDDGADPDQSEWDGSDRESARRRRRKIKLQRKKGNRKNKIRAVQIDIVD
jgi:hypothetical protein